MKNYLVIGMLALVLAIVVVQSFQISAIKGGQVTGNVAAGGAIDMTGWTETEKMEYEHHGVLPQRLQGASKASAQSSQPAAMVGGC